MPPVVAGVSLRVLDLLESSPELRTQLFDNARYFRAGLASAGFKLKPGEHPIIPVMLGDAALAGRMAERAAAARRVRHRLLIPGRAEGTGAHPHADVGGADARAARPRDRGIRSGRARNSE